MRRETAAAEERPRRNRMWIPLAGIFVGILLQAGCQSTPTSQSSSSHSHGAAESAAVPTPRIPAYFETADAARPLPKVLDPNMFSTPVVVKAYGYARENPELFAQQPCYCACDNSNGHRSLLDCYATDHSAG